MGGYLFLTSEGKQIWRLNLSGAIVWYGLLEEIGGKNLTKALREDHNWGQVWDAAGYHELGRDCIRSLQSGMPLPSETEAYRVKRKQSVEQFRADALRIFRGSLQKLPRTGRFIAADDLNMDWLEEPCICEICTETPGPNPLELQRRFSNRSSPAGLG